MDIVQTFKEAELLSSVQKESVSDRILNSMQWSTSLGIELEFLFPKSEFDPGPFVQDIWDIENNWRLGYEGLYGGQEWLGLELKSPVYDGKSKPKFETIAGFVTSSGGLVNDTCGLHVHAGLKQYPWKKWSDIARQSFANYTLVEPLIAFPFERMHEEKNARKSVALAFGLCTMGDRLDLARQILDGDKHVMMAISERTQTLYPQRDSKPYQTLEWKGPAGTLCPVQIASAMKFWNDLTGLSAEIALSDNGPALPDTKIFQRLSVMAKNYSRNIEQSSAYNADFWGWPVAREDIMDMARLAQLT